MNTLITKLPDGSGCFTATIMSKEEAMVLPLKERPLCFRISGELYTAVHEAIGAASMCWNPRPSNEVFSSEEASDVAVKLCFKIAESIEEQNDVYARASSLPAQDLARLHLRNEARLSARITQLEDQIEKLLAHCPDAECGECAKIMCPEHCDMHFHHDGCPACCTATEESQ